MSCWVGVLIWRRMQVDQYPWEERWWPENIIVYEDGDISGNIWDCMDHLAAFVDSVWP